MQLGSAVGSNPLGVGPVTSALPETGTTALREMEATTAQRASGMWSSRTRSGGRGGGLVRQTAVRRAAVRPPLETKRAAEVTGSTWTRRGLAAQRRELGQGVVEPRSWTSGPVVERARETRRRGRTCTDLLLGIGLTKGATGTAELVDTPGHLSAEDLIVVRELLTSQAGVDTVWMKMTVAAGTRNAVHVGVVRVRTRGPTGDPWRTYAAVERKRRDEGNAAQRPNPRKGPPRATCPERNRGGMLIGMEAGMLNLACKGLRSMPAVTVDLGHRVETKGDTGMRTIVLRKGVTGVILT